MPSRRTRFVVKLDERDALRLRALAERNQVSPETLAARLLSRALEDADPEPVAIVSLLDSIPGAFDRAKQGMREIRAGGGIPLSEF